MSAVNVDAITVEYARGGQSIRPLHQFSLSVPTGSLVLLLGPSGCGKTTLLSCLAGILKPSAGQVVVGGSAISELRGKRLTEYRRSGVGIVFQAFNLVPSLDAVENVMIPLRANGVSMREARSVAIERLTSVGLGDRLRNKPGQLSGGQQQRVGIARALAMDPPLLLADEPTASLDHTQVETVLRILRGLVDQGRTVIVSTHDPRMLGLADHVIDMVPRQSIENHGPEVQHLEAGRVLFEQNSRGTLIYQVVSGQIELSGLGPEGPWTALCGPGDEFGEMGAVFDLQRSATARASTDAAVIGYTVAEFKERFGVPHLMDLIANYAPRD